MGAHERKDRLAVEPGGDLGPPLLGRAVRRLGEQLDPPAINAAPPVDFLQVGAEQRPDARAGGPLGQQGAHAQGALSHARHGLAAEALQVGEQIGHVGERHPVAGHGRMQLVARRVEPQGYGALEQPLVVGRMGAPSRPGRAVGPGKDVPAQIRGAHPPLAAAPAVAAMAAAARHGVRRHLDGPGREHGRDLAARRARAGAVDLPAPLLRGREALGGRVAGRAMEDAGEQQGHGRGLRAPLAWPRP